MAIKKIIQVCMVAVFFTLHLTCPAQQKSRYNFFSYSVNEGLLQSAVLDLAIDKNNFCWLSFSNGIQRFDGNKFEIIPLQPGLPDDKNVELYKQKNDELIFIHSKGISKYNIQKNNFEQVYSLTPGMTGKLKLIGEMNGLIYLYGSDATVIALESSTYKKQFTFALPFLLPVSVTRIPVFSKIENGIVHIFYQNKLYQYQLTEKRLLNQSGHITGLQPFFLKANGDDNLLCFKQDKVWQLSNYNYSSKQFTTIFQKDVNSQIFRGQLFKWGSKNLMLYYDRLFLMSSDWRKDSAEIVDFKNNRITESFSILKMESDNFENLYIVTINDGIRKLIKHSYPIRYYGVPGTKKCYALCVYPDKRNNKVLMGSFGNGLLIFDTLQNLVKHIEYLPGEKEHYSVNGITRNSKGEYLFKAIGKKNIYKLSSDLKKIAELPTSIADSVVLPDVQYFSNLVYDSPDKAIIQTEYKFFIINKITDKVVRYHTHNSQTHSSLLFNGKIIIHSNDQIKEYDTTNFNQLLSIDFPGTSGVRCYATDGRLLYFGSNKGIFITDDKYRIVKKYNRETGLPDECIYAIQIDKNKNLWVSTNKGITRISPSGQLFQLTRDDGLQENEFNNNVSYQTADGELFFGGVSGVNSFYPAMIPNYTSDAGIYITDIKINNVTYQSDTAIQYIKKLVLPYDQNSIELSFIASGPLNADRYVHQYKMEGIDKQWLQKVPGEAVHYALPPGKYIFKTYAASYFDKNAAPLRELHITIRPPFWKTWWFLSLLCIGALGAIIYLINRYNSARYQKRVALLLTQQKVQEERGRISMELHDSIGAYANAVLYNTDLLQEEKNEIEKERIMKDLRFASKDIITSLRETIWALKKENYSATDCLMRIRNFMHPFSRYYTSIDFKVEGVAPSDKELHYGLALNIVRIVQESVNNSIKHSNPSSIFIKSTVINKTGWQLEITDNGKGFNMNEIKPGNGLVNMKNRAAEWNFGVEIESAPGVGTHTTIVVP